MAKSARATRRPGRPRREPAQPDPDRRAQLCSAALDLFARDGFARVSIKQIAAGAGVDPALIYYYFAGKEDLFAAAVGHAVENGYAMFARLAGDGDYPVMTIAAWLDAQEGPGSTIPKMARLGLDYRRSGAAIPAVDDALRRFYDEERRMLMRAVRTGLARGLFRDVAPGPFARFVSTYLDGVLVRTVILDEDGPAAVDRFRVEVWRRLGLQKPPRRRKFIAD